MALVDVTFRDGGFAVGFRWPQHVVHEVVACLDRLGVTAVELGYIGGLPELHGAASAGTAADLTPSQVASCAVSNTLLTAMVHPSAAKQPIDFAAFRNAGLGLVRVVYHESWRDHLCALVGEAQEAGLSVTVNMALASRYDERGLYEQAAWLWEHAQPDVLYLADTCGALYPRDVSRLITALVESAPGDVGFHAHDFLSLAFANSLAAADAGARYVDASLLGLGRAAGNLRTELWLAAGEPRVDRGWDLALLVPILIALRAVGPREPDNLFSVACAVMNLTPPEEDLLISYARNNGDDPSQLALALASRPDRLSGELTIALISEALHAGDR